MQYRNHKAGYGLINILIHWVMAVAVIGLFFVGEEMVDMTYYDELYTVLPWWHKSVGLAMFALLALRIVWKVSNPKPSSLPTHATWEKVLAHSAHWAFYLLLLIAFISGYLISTAKGAGIDFFGWFDIPAITTLEEGRVDLVGKIHEVSTHLIFFLAIFHALGALKHHFIDRDSTLKRMIFPTQPKTED